LDIKSVSQTYNTPIDNPSPDFSTIDPNKPELDEIADIPNPNNNTIA